MVQEPPKPFYSGNRPITAKENLFRVFTGEKPEWMPLYLVESQYCWPDVYAEHALFEGDGLDWWGQEWIYVPVAGGQMPKPGTRVTKWRKQVTFPDLDAV